MKTVIFLLEIYHDNTWFVRFIIYRLFRWVYMNKKKTKMRNFFKMVRRRGFGEENIEGRRLGMNRNSSCWRKLRPSGARLPRDNSMNPRTIEYWERNRTNFWIIFLNDFVRILPSAYIGYKENSWQILRIEKWFLRCIF